MNIDTELFFNVTQQNPFAEPITCEAGFNDFITTSSNTLNTLIIGLFGFYVLILFATQYLLEKEQLTTKQYVNIHRIFNNYYVAVTLVLVIYAYLLA